MDALHFIFSSFWVWLGFAILLSIVTAGVSQVLALLLSAIASH